MSDTGKMSTMEVKEVLDDLFEQQALALGGLVALHDPEDDLVWQLVESMDVIRGRVLRQLRDNGSGLRHPDKAALRPHPAIQEFLSKLHCEVS
jgi:hypothetical protein